MFLALTTGFKLGAIKGSLTQMGLKSLDTLNLAQRRESSATFDHILQTSLILSSLRISPSASFEQNSNILSKISYGTPFDQFDFTTKFELELSSIFDFVLLSSFAVFRILTAAFDCCSSSLDGEKSGSSDSSESESEEFKSQSNDEKRKQLMETIRAKNLDLISIVLFLQQTNRP